jgi:SAM-dependent methyltransferase
MPLVAGDLLRLPFADASLGGAVAFYSLIYGEESYLTRCLREIRRVLRHEGVLLAAVHGGTGADHFDSYEGRPIDVTIVARAPDRLATLAGAAGFLVRELRVREPYRFEHQSQRVYLRATRA